MTRGVGRPKTGFLGLDQEIIKYLLSQNTGATWGDLKNKEATEVVNSASLKKSLDRLIDAGIIGTQVETRKGRRAVLYVIKEPLLFTKIPGVHSSLLSWIERVIDHIERGQGPGPDKGTRIDNLTQEEKRRLLDVQDHGIDGAIRWLGVLILDAMVEANNKDGEMEQRKYLDKFCCTYLNVLISEFAYLASDACGNSTRAYEVGLEVLDANNLSSYISGEWPPSGKPDEKKGNEPA